ncbi:MAG: 50S ribosomal protein L10 [Acidobacteriota bacterium]|nr:50S ribosomal protein L10 [Acidobacteriota bacterium]
MKTREQKQKDLNALTEQLSNSKSAMVISFNRVTVNKDQELREQLRSAGANYKVVKNTIARLAVAGTPYAGADEHFKGVSAIAWTDTDPVILSKTVSKFVKANGETFSFKVGVVDGRVVNLSQVEAIASLPSKEELISKLLFVINAQAQRIVTVINAVPRNLAVVIKLIGDAKPAEQQTVEPKTEQPQATAEPSDTTEESTETVAAQADEQVPVQEEPKAETAERSADETAAAPETSQEEPATE